MAGASGNVAGNADLKIGGGLKVCSATFSIIFAREESALRSFLNAKRI